MSGRWWKNRAREGYHWKNERTKSCLAKSINQPGISKAQKRLSGKWPLSIRLGRNKNKVTSFWKSKKRSGGNESTAKKHSLQGGGISFFYLTHRTLEYLNKKYPEKRNDFLKEVLINSLYFPEPLPARKY